MGYNREQRKYIKGYIRERIRRGFFDRNEEDCCFYFQGIDNFGDDSNYYYYFNLTQATLVITNGFNETVGVYGYRPKLYGEKPTDKMEILIPYNKEMFKHTNEDKIYRDIDGEGIAVLHVCSIYRFIDLIKEMRRYELWGL